MPTVKVVNNQIDVALKALKKKVREEGITEDLKKHQHFVSRGEARRMAERKAVARMRRKQRRMNAQE